MDNRRDGLPNGNNPIIDDGWTDPLANERLVEVLNDGLFNDQKLLLKAQEAFYNSTIEGIKTARVVKKQAGLAQKYSRLVKDGYVSHLLDNINRSLEHPDQQQAINLFRRLHNNFFLVTQAEIQGRDIIIKILESLLFELYLRQYPAHREKLIIALFKINTLLAQKIDQATQPKGFKKIAQVITGKSTALIGHDEDTGRLRLQLEHQSDQLLLTGPVSAKATTPKSPQKPQYPGHIFDPESIAKNIDKLVKTGFDISEGLLAAQAANREAEALGQLFTAISHIVKKDLPIYCVTKDAEAQKTIKPFRSPSRLRDDQLNILGNILVANIKRNPKLHKPITSGVKKLKIANSKLFDDLEREFFFKESMADAGIINPAVPPTVKPTISRPESVVIKPIEAVAAEEDFSALEPLDRLEKIYFSNSIDFRQLASYDPYARGVLSLILCGKKHPLPEELAAGYRRWQHLVHPDKNPTELAKDFTRIINDIGQLARRQEFIRNKASQAIEQLFELTKRMLAESSIMIIPRQGKRHIILNSVSVGTMLNRQKYDRETVKVFLQGRLIDRSEFDQTALSVGDVIEVVTF